MLTFFRVLYLLFVAIVEISAAFMFMALFGVVVTVVVEILLFIVLMMIYAVIFGKWRPSLGFLTDFF